jgi:hypothetical protein
MALFCEYPHFGVTLQSNINTAIINLSFELIFEAPWICLFCRGFPQIFYKSA